MPRQKTHRASAKRFKHAGSEGGLKRFRVYISPFPRKQKQRRHLRKASMVHAEIQTYQSNAYSLEIIAYL